MKWIWTIAICLCLTQVQSQQFLNPGFNHLFQDDPAWTAISDTIKGQLEETGILLDVGQLLHNFFATLKSSSFPTAVARNISQQCIDDSQSYVHNLYLNRSLWALQMLESSGRMPPGLFGSYNLHADGLFDECQAVRAPDFDGQYCTVFFSAAPVDPSEIIPTENYQLSRTNFITIFELLGLVSGPDRVEPKVSEGGFYSYILPSINFCVPSSCSAEDLGRAVAELVGGFVIANYSIVTVINEQYCFKESNKPKPLDGPDIAVIVTLSFVSLLVVSATIHEAWRMYRDVKFDARKDGHLINLLHCFSVLNNGRKILSMKVSTSSDNLGCIHGIRFFSTCWVVLGHFWGFSIYKSMNPKAIHTDALNWGMQTIVNATVSVDTFFLISGLLVSYLLLKELDRNKGRFNVGLFYLHRYLRLTLVYAVILGFIATLMVYVGTGPNWYSVNLVNTACRIEWWKQFLYINNFFPDEYFQMCMGQTWYLAVDMQLFLVSPLLIYPLWRWRKYGLAWLAFICLASHAAIFAIYAVYDLMPSSMPTRVLESDSSSEAYHLKYYFVPWTRAPPYLIGIWLGWYFHVTKESEIRISKVLVAIGWFTSVVVGLAVLYGLAPYADISKVPEIDPALKMTYGPLHRTAWALSIAWIIFACTRGYGGIVNRFLAWKGFLPLSRLTYCAYLIHYDFINVFYSAIRKQFYYTMFSHFTTFFGVLVIIFGLAFLTSVTLEASFLNVEKLLFSSRLPKDTPVKEIDSSIKFEKEKDPDIRNQNA